MVSIYVTYRNKDTGQVFVDDKKDFKQIRMRMAMMGDANGVQMIDERVCYSKKTIRKYIAKMKEKHNAIG